MGMIKTLFENLRRLKHKRPRDKNLLFTRKNIRLDREFEFCEKEACFYVEVWFDAEKKFGLKLTDDDYVNVYAFLAPDTGDVRLTYIIHYCDGFIDNERKFTALTHDEKELIRTMANEVSLKETGMTVDDFWNSLNNEGCSDDTAISEGVIS